LYAAEEAGDVVEVSTRTAFHDREKEGPPKVDANFFNKFDDDFDESDMKPSS